MTFLFPLDKCHVCVLKHLYLSSSSYFKLSLATRGEDWASQGQPKGKAEIPVVTRECRRNSRKHVVPTAWQDEALARDGVSREVPCSALKGETVPDSLPATPKSPPTRRVPPRGTPRVPAPLPLSPFSPPDRDRRGESPAWSGRGSQPSRRTSG